jgi:DNA-binding MarR family transcriptional regulator
MQQLEAPREECAREILDAVPVAMRAIRAQLRKHSGSALSVPQFRTLLFINRHRGASISEVADHIGLTLPSMSTLVDGLVTRNFVLRRVHEDDRRRMTLTLSERGDAALLSARTGAQSYLTERLKPLPEAQRVTILRAMRILKRVFSEEVE